MIKKIQALLAIALVFTLIACEKDFEELNKNPFKPTQVEIGPLFNSVIQSLTLGWNEQLYLNNETIYKLTQQAALSATTFQNVSIGTEEVWSRYYAALSDIRDIESRMDNFEDDQEATNNVRAMLKVVLAYKTFRLSDLFGGMPFFDAGKGFENLELVRPKFDTQEAIYKALLDDLKWVNDNANINPAPTTAAGEAYISFNGFDQLFNEDMAMWVKFANSLRLRHAIRMVEKEPTLANEIIKEILENDLPLIEAGEEVAMWPSKLAWRNEGMFWSFREHKKMRMGTTMWNQLSDSDATDGSGIFDKRVHIFFEPNNENEWVAFPQNPTAATEPSGGSPYQQLRDDNHSFKGVSNIYSPFNYFLIRDEDYVPELLQTAAEVHFLKAEAYLRGLGVALDEDKAKQEYKAGVTTSIVFWHNIAGSTPIWTVNTPVLEGQEQFVIYNHPSINFTGGTDKLELIYKQRWIDAFRQPWEAYALGRRTKETPIEGQRIEHNRFSYPPSEIENNPENWSTHVAEMGADDELTKVWWME